jgi:hypothetical protein
MSTAVTDTAQASPFRLRGNDAESIANFSPASPDDSGDFLYNSLLRL